MPLEWKKDESGNPVINNGKVVLVDTETQGVYEVDPANSHGRMLALQKDLPEKNTELKTIKAQLAAYEDLQSKYPDIYSNPSDIVAKMQRLTDLEKNGGEVNEQIATIRAEHDKLISEERKVAADQKTTLEGEITKLKQEMTLQKYIIPWMSSELMTGVTIPRSDKAIRALLLDDASEQRLEFLEDGTIKDYTGIPLQDTTPDGVLKYILENHPDRDTFITSKFAAGGGMPGKVESVGGGGTSSIEKFYDPKSDSYNLTEQLKLSESDPVKHSEMVQKFS